MIAKVNEFSSCKLLGTAGSETVGHSHLGDETCIATGASDLCMTSYGRCRCDALSVNTMTYIDPPMDAILVRQKMSTCTSSIA